MEHGSPEIEGETCQGRHGQHHETSAKLPRYQRRHAQRRGHCHLRSTRSARF